MRNIEHVLVEPCGGWGKIACFALQVQSVVFASTGTLLLCLVDTTGHLASMRLKIREAFPGASSQHMYRTSILPACHNTMQEHFTCERVRS